MDRALGLWRARLVHAVGVACALLVAGCGSADRPAPSKPQFIARADAICRLEDVKLEYVERRARALEGASPASFRTVPYLIRKAVAIHEVANDKLEALARPARDAAAIGRWLTARIVAATVALDAAEAPRGKDLAAARDLQAQLTRQLALAHALARGFGFTVCDAAE